MNECVPVCVRQGHVGRRFHLGLKYTHPYYTTLFSVYKTKFLGLDHLQECLYFLVKEAGGLR